MTTPLPVLLSAATHCILSLLVLASISDRALPSENNNCYPPFRPCIRLRRLANPMSRTSSPDVIFKTAMLLVLLVAIFIVLLGGGLNNNQVKYSRFHAEGACAQGLFVKEIEESQFCCDKHYHETDWYEHL